MEKIALITGITGQDGSYLAKLLLTKGYLVHGTSRTPKAKNWRHHELSISKQLTINECDLTDRDAVITLITTIQPTEIYHLAAQSSVSESFTVPYETFCQNTLSTLTLLEVVRAIDINIKIFNASSSEIFDQFAPQPLSLTSPRLPASPYGISKLAGHMLVEQYRTTFRLFAVNGILFPHESPLRQPNSFIKTVIRKAIACTQNEQGNIALGYIDTERDFGYAASYVEMMWRSLQAQTATDYIIATGQTTSLRTIVEYIAKKLNLPQTTITSSPIQQSTLPTSIYGDITDTTAKLGEFPITNLYATIDAMIEFEMRYHARR